MPMKKLFAGSRFILFCAVLALLGVGAAILNGCGNSTVASSSGTGNALVSLEVSDPSTCQAPNGPYKHVYVTISDVKVNTSASAADSDSGWVDLTPALAAAPQQVDLLGLPATSCFLASLGDKLALQPGSYQQIRVILTDNAGSVSGNVCQNTANCVVTSDGTVNPLQLSSETKTGIKIPAGQIANGSFTISAGQTEELDIDFNTCVSIVQEGNGKFRLKPVLHAGEVSTAATSINGTVVDSGTGKPVVGALVALEQKDPTASSPVDRVFMATLTDANGNFVFCPLPTSTYDVVVVGTAGAPVYSPTVVTAVATGSALTKVPLHALPVISAAAATLTGTVSSAGTGATSIDLQLSVLSTLSSGLTVTVPLLPSLTQSSATAAVSTQGGSGCSNGTDCATYNLVVSAGPIFAGAFSASGTTYTQDSSTASYTVDALAFVASSGGTPDCSVTEQTTSAVTPVAAVITSMSPLQFTGCS